MPEILTLVIATGNPGKIAEIRDLLTGFPIDIKTLDPIELPEIIPRDSRIIIPLIPFF